jgi:hypothetical protein
MAAFFSNPVGPLVIAGLIVVYILTYTLNKNTPVPEACQDIFEEASCGACNNFACSHKK